MMDPKKLIALLPRLDQDRPLRFLGRRVVQAIAEAATANLLLGRRTAPGRYLTLRHVETDADRDRWEQEFAESKGTILAEIQREIETREINLRTALDLDLLVVTAGEMEKGEAERALATVLPPDEIAAACARLREEHELILPRQVRTLVLESEPPEAQVYVDHQPVGVTPCRVDDIPEGEHVLTFSQRGYLLYETTLRIEPGPASRKVTHRAVLTPEPAMGVLEVRTFPPEARVTVGEETRISPARWRLPAGPVEVRVEKAEFGPLGLQVEVPPTREDRPHVLQLRLDYAGPDADEVVGRLIVYKPSRAPAAPVEPPRPADSGGSQTIRSFFQDQDPEGSLSAWGLPETPPPPAPAPPEIAGERPLRRGVLLIGRRDPRSDLVPDVNLIDAENSVSRGCHAWLYVYADTSTGASYNTFLIGNNSSLGVRVNGTLLMESRRLPDDAEIEIGNFRMRVVKELPEARVEF